MKTIRIFSIPISIPSQSRAMHYSMIPIRILSISIKRIATKPSLKSAQTTGIQDNPITIKSTLRNQHLSFFIVYHL